MRPSEGKYLGEGLIELPLKATTKTRLHELAHKRLGHEPGMMPARELVDREIDAETWAWEAMDKKPTHRVGLPAMQSLIEDYDYSIREAVGLVISRLKAKGIPITRAVVEDLTRFARGEF